MLYKRCLEIFLVFIYSIPDQPVAVVLRNLVQCLVPMLAKFQTIWPGTCSGCLDTIEVRVIVLCLDQQVSLAQVCRDE